MRTPTPCSMLFSVASSELTGGAGICSSFVTDILADDGQKEPAIPDDLQHVKEINILNNDPPLDVSSEEAADFWPRLPYSLIEFRAWPANERLAVQNRCPEGLALPVGLPAKEEAAGMTVFCAESLKGW